MRLPRQFEHTAFLLALLRLGLLPPASRADVLRAYRKLARSHHPDRAATDEARRTGTRDLQEINQARAYVLEYIDIFSGTATSGRAPKRGAAPEPVSPDYSTMGPLDPRD